MGRRHLIAALVTASLTLGAPALAALSDEGEEEAPKAPSADEFAPLSFWFDEETGLLVFGASPTDATEPLDCMPEEGSITVGEDGTVEGEAPDGCHAIVIDGGENGVSHGDAVSQTVRALKELRDDLDAPFGHYVREIAQSDIGKPDHDDDEGEESGEGEETEATEDDGNGPPDHAQARGHDKKADESGSEAGNGNGNGPPAHAPAHGRNR